jgi:hypothetical protein
MKKFLHLSNYLIFLGLSSLVLCLNSCKKENFRSSIVLDNGITSQISNADIEKWANNNQFVKYLALDWKNAKQTVFKGRQVIKITLLNENRLPQNVSDGNKKNSTPNNYFEQHPPEVFLVKDEKDSLHSSFLNFIPDDQNKGFGQQGQWTGKLYEWNMNSDTLFVQKIKDNRLIEKYILKTPVNISVEEKRMKGKGMKTNSIWDFFNTVLDFFNNIGYFLGIPGTSNHLWYDSDCAFGYDCIRGNWVGDLFGWIGQLFSGWSSPDYTGPWGTPDFGGYLDMNGFYANYLHNATGGGGGYTPYPVYYASTEVYLNISSATFETQDLIARLNLSESEDNALIYELINNEELATDLRNYFMDSGQTQADKDFVKWAARFNIEIGTPVEELTPYADDIKDLFNEYTDDYNFQTATCLTVLAFKNNSFGSNYVIQNYCQIHGIPYDPMLAIYFNAQVAIIKKQHPEWSTWRVYWEASREAIHMVLDVGGLVPVIGEVCDLANGIIYTVEGDGINASLSFAATIPVAGWASTGAKYAIKAVDAVGITKTTLKWIKKADGVINFGLRGQLRKVLKLAPGNPVQAHHIIPWEFTNNTVVQKAAEYGFHMNEALNGIGLAKNIHVEGIVHSHYNTKVAQELQEIINRRGMNLSPEVAESELIGLISKIRTWINANPGVNLNNITFQ